MEMGCCGWFIQLSSGAIAGSKPFNRVVVSIERFPQGKGPWDEGDSISDLDAREASAEEVQEFIERSEKVHGPLVQSALGLTIGQSPDRGGSDDPEFGWSI